MEWHPHLTRSLVFQMNLLMSLMCSFVKNVCIWAGAKKSQIWSNHCRYGNQWWQSLYIYTWSWLDLIQIYFCIFLWCCMLGLNWNIHDLIWCVGKDCHWQIKNIWISPHCGGVWTWERERVSLGWSCGSLVSFWLNCLIWWVFGGHIWLLISWFCLWQLDSSWFDSFGQIILGSVYMATVQVAEVFSLCMLIWFIACESTTCCYLQCRERCSIWFVIRQRLHWLCQNNIELPQISWISSVCHREGVRWCMGPTMCQWRTWTWTPLRQMIICLQGIDP